MTTLVLNENGTVQFPASLLKILGWQIGNRLEIKTDKNMVTLINQNSAKTKDLSDFEKEIEESFGMVTVHRGKNPESILDVDVARYATLFDEN